MSRLTERPKRLSDLGYNMASIYDYLDKWTATAITQNVLKTVRSDVDKREGSVIYDAVAPLSFMIAAVLQMLKTVLANTDLQTATGDWLDMLGADKGVYRKQATVSRRIAAVSPLGILLNIGARFETKAGLGLFWTVTGTTENEGEYIVECETAGSAGGSDYGELSPVVPVDGLSSFAFVSTMIYGADEESDLDFRLRIWQSLTSDAYGGNYADYKNWVFNAFAESANGSEIDGMMIYPAFDGGGTVKIFPTAAEYDSSGNAMHYLPASAAACDALKAYLDPIDASGLGAGVVPVGHRVTVEALGESVLYLTVNVELKSGQTVTDDLRRAVYEDLQTYIESVRRASLTLSGDSFPREGYAVSITLDGLVNAIQGLGAGLVMRFEQVVSIYINGIEITSTNKLEWTQSADDSSLPIVCDYGDFILAGV